MSYNRFFYICAKHPDKHVEYHDRVESLIVDQLISCGGKSFCIWKVSLLMIQGKLILLVFSRVG